LADGADIGILPNCLSYAVPTASEKNMTIDSCSQIKDLGALLSKYAREEQLVTEFKFTERSVCIG